MATKITASATTLYRVAAEQYGDASQWWRIARANGISDLMVDGVTTLTIPAADPSVSGDGLPLEDE